MASRTGGALVWTMLIHAFVSTNHAREQAHALIQLNHINTYNAQIVLVSNFSFIEKFIYDDGVLTK